MTQERELLQLRPLKDQLNTYSESSKEQIEANVRSEFEKNKMSKQVMDLQNDLDRFRSDNEELTTSNFTLTEQNTILVEQIRSFEK
jgi:hypothetical protein